MKHVSQYDAEHLERSPFPELHRPPAEIRVGNGDDDDGPLACNATMEGCDRRSHDKTQEISSEADNVKLHKRNAADVTQEVEHGEVDVISKPPSDSGPGRGQDKVGHSSSVYLLTFIPFRTQDIQNVLMIRERVDIYGVSKAMEPPEQIHALKLPPEQIGIIKEGPVLRWF